MKTPPDDFLLVHYEDYIQIDRADLVVKDGEYSLPVDYPDRLLSHIRQNLVPRLFKKVEMRVDMLNTDYSDCIDCEPPF